jgi:hypothetical protein
LAGSQNLTPPSHILVNLRNNQQLHHLHLLIMLFKCGLCTFIMDSRVHGNLPCDMCGEENPKRIPLDPSEWDIFLADDYNSLFPPCVAEYRAAIGRPINDVDGGVGLLIPHPRHCGNAQILIGVRRQDSVER